MQAYIDQVVDASVLLLVEGCDPIASWVAKAEIEALLGQVQEGTNVDIPEDRIRHLGFMGDPRLKGQKQSTAADMAQRSIAVLGRLRAKQRNADHD